jgi:hypothetical protein
VLYFQYVTGLGFAAFLHRRRSPHLCTPYA